MGNANSMQILRMDGGFKVICDHVEDHHVMKFLAIQFGKHNVLLNGVMLALQYHHQLASCEMKPHLFFAISLSKSEGRPGITWTPGWLMHLSLLGYCTISVT